MGMMKRFDQQQIKRKQQRGLAQIVLGPVLGDD